MNLSKIINSIIINTFIVVIMELVVAESIIKFITIIIIVIIKTTMIVTMSTVMTIAVDVKANREMNWKLKIMVTAKIKLKQVPSLENTIINYNFSFA